MKKDPMRTLGVVFSIIAAVEAIVLVGMLCGLLEGSPNRDTRLGLGIACFVLGIQILVFGSLGGGFLYSLRKKEERREALVAGGYSEIASVFAVEPVTTVTVNGRHPYRVLCRIERDGVQHEYRSDMFNEMSNLLPGDPIRVYLDPRNENRYYVDVDIYLNTVVRH